MKIVVHPTPYLTASSKTKWMFHTTRKNLIPKSFVNYTLHSLFIRVASIPPVKLDRPRFFDSDAFSRSHCCRARKLHPWWRLEQEQVQSRRLGKRSHQMCPCPGLRLWMWFVVSPVSNFRGEIIIKLQSILQRHWFVISMLQVNTPT